MDFNTEESLIRKWNLWWPRKEELKELDLLSRHGITSGDNGDNGDVDCSLRLGLPSGSTRHSSINSHPYPPQVDCNNHGFMTVGSAIHPWNLHRSDSLLRSADVAGNCNGDGNTTTINGFIDFLSVTPSAFQKILQKPNSTEVHFAESSENIKRCAFCRKSSTPLWRKGPSGRKTLCNACGIRFKKQEKKALRINDYEKSKENTNKLKS